ncbi:MAG TPA: ABC transporter substrate-binding protein [Candidatus Binatia bacterium]|jgi:putative ABC transport system substrate-binding protein
MRKTLHLLTIITLLAWPPAAAAQQPAKVARVGFVSSTGDPKAPGPLVEAFRDKLRELGHVEGKNIRVEYRYAEGKLDRVPGFVEELVRSKVDALVVSSVPAIRAAKRAATTVPVVMVISVDPVAIGIVENLARPGGNITGIVSLSRELRKQGLELLKEAVPRLARVGILWNSEGRAAATAFKDYEAAAPLRRVQVQSLEVRGSTLNLEGAFQAAVKGRAGALIAVSNAALAHYSKQIAELALKNRLPSMSERSEYAAAGGLMDYSADYTENFKRVAVYVDKILKGAKPGDLPIEPSKFDLVINLKTAKQLGLTIPPDLIKRASRVVK